MRHRTIALLAAAGIAAIPATAQGHNTSARADCKLVTVGASAFPTSGPSVITFDHTVNGFPQGIFQRVFTATLPEVSYGATGNDLAGLVGTNTVAVYVAWNAPDGSSPRRLIYSRTFDCIGEPPEAPPTPAPTPTPPEVTPPATPAPPAAPPRVTTPTIILPRPDRPTVRRFTTCRSFRAAYPKAGPKRYTARGWYNRCNVPRSRVVSRVAVTG